MRGTLELLADCINARSTCRGVDGGRVAEVGVDACEKLAVGGFYALDDDVALGALLAVTAGTVELTEGVDSEAIDRDGAGAVVLDYFVLCAGGASADDCAGAC